MDVDMDRYGGPKGKTLAAVCGFGQVAALSISAY
jgi:hypothetical protein